MIGVMDVQVLLEVVERCLEGTEDVANPSDVEHAVDNVLQSTDDVVDVHLVHDALLNFDFDLSLDDLLDHFLALDAADELQDQVHDDILDLPGQPNDALLFLYDNVYVFDVSLVLLTLDGYVALDAGHLADVSTLFYQVVDVLDGDAHLHSHCRCLSVSRCCNHCGDGLLDVDAKVEATLLHMMSLLDGSILCLDATLLDELDNDASLDALLLANSNDAIHEVAHDPNTHDEMANDATRPLGTLPSDDPILPLRWARGIQDGVVQRCCRQLDAEALDDVCSVMMHSLLVLHSRCHTRCVMSAPHR